MAAIRIRSFSFSFFPIRLTWGCAARRTTEESSGGVTMMVRKEREKERKRERMEREKRDGNPSFFRRRRDLKWTLDETRALEKT